MNARQHIDSRILEKYLKHYAEVEVQALKDFPDQTYRHALLIPAFMESTSFLQRLQNLGPQDRFLLILISNHPTKISPDILNQALNDHEEIKHWLGESCWSCSNLSLYPGEKFDTILVDRTNAESIPDHEGVGLARKIGADIAATLRSKGNLLTDWVMSSDADAHLPADYFAISPPANNSALTYPFIHAHKNDRVGQATELYEASINHYVDGLHKAGSPYAFHTVGSAQAVNLLAYAVVRGYPRRSGGEDFYLLNKLAKVGKVSQLKKPIIQIEARLSDRAPFGTGPAVKRLQESADMYAEPVFYQPAIFDHLQQLLACLRADAFNELNQKIRLLPEDARHCLHQLGVENALLHAEKQALSGQILRKHMHDWFDGFRTLRFVHLMRDRAFPSLNHKQWLAWLNE